MRVQGLSEKTYNNLQLNSGAFFENLGAFKNATELKTAIKTAMADGRCLGATSGGGSFQATPTFRNIQMDGARAPFKGSAVIDAWEVKLTTNLKEITADNLGLTLTTSELEADGALSILKMRTNIEESDYIDSLCWVGNKMDGGLMVIKLDNVLNINGANFTFTDKGEGTLPVDFRAYVSGFSDEDYAPFQVIFVDPETGNLTE